MDNETNINEQLDILEETKQQLKEAIISKGQEISENDSFRSYVDKIEAIETGIDTSDATAIAGDIAGGKTAYVNGQKITGSIDTANQVSNLDPNTSTYTTAGPTISVLNATTGNNSKQIIEPNTTMQVAIFSNRLASALHLTADKLKKDETILGVTGTLEEGIDTSDANAVASNIEIGKTAYVNGQKITGSLNVVDNQGHQVTNLDPTAVTLNWDMGSALLLETVYGPVTPVIIKPNDNFSMAINKSTLASIISLTADKIKLGEIILGITGTYAGETMKEYASETAMNNDIANIQEGEVVKVVENNTTTFYIKETTMKKLVKEEDTLSPTEYTEALEDVDDILGKEVV